MSFFSNVCHRAPQYSRLSLLRGHCRIYCGGYSGVGLFSSIHNDYATFGNSRRVRRPTVDASKLTSEMFLSKVSHKSVADIPEKYHKRINENIPSNVDKYILVNADKSRRVVDFDEALALAKEQNKDLILNAIDPKGWHILSIGDYNEEQQKILQRLQKQEADTLYSQTVNSLKGKPRGTLEQLSLRIDRHGAEMKANLAKKVLLKGKFVMFQAPAYTPEDAEIAKSKLQFVKDFVQNNYPDVAFVSSDIEVWKKRAFIEFSPSEAILQEKREQDAAKQKSQRAKFRERTRNVQVTPNTNTQNANPRGAQPQRNQPSSANAKKPGKKRLDPNNPASFNNPFKGQRFRIDDF